MAETPEEVALRRALMALRLEVDGSIVDGVTKYADAALRAQYVAGLEKALWIVSDEDEGPHGQDYQLGDVEDFRKRCIKAIRGLAEQAKKEGV